MLYTWEMISFKELNDILSRCPNTECQARTELLFAELQTALTMTEAHIRISERAIIERDQLRSEVELLQKERHRLLEVIEAME